VHKAVSDTLYVYRRHCAVSANPGQLILPESLKLLPLYALALTKMAAFRCVHLHSHPQFPTHAPLIEAPSSCCRCTRWSPPRWPPSGAPPSPRYPATLLQTSRVKDGGGEACLYARPGL